MKKKTDVSVIIMVVVIVAVAVLGGFAIAPTISNIVAQNQAEKLAERMANGTATVSDLANSEGLKMDEFLAKYELKADDVAADASMTTFMEKLTLKNYCAFAGVEYSDEALEEYKAVYNAADETATEGEDEDKKEKAELTADTTDMEAKYGFASYLYTLQQEELNGPVEVDSEAEAEAEAEVEAEAEAEAE